MGHSFGGLVVQRFALDYPEDAAGVVLLDPMRTDEWPPVNEKALAKIARAQRLTRVGEWLAWIGLGRLTARSHFCGSGKVSGFFIRLAGAQGEHLSKRLNSEIAKMSPEIRPSIAAHWSTPQFYGGLNAYLSNVPDTVNEMHDVGPLHDVPVTVIRPAGSFPFSDTGQFGPDFREVIAERSRHWVHLDEPELVVQTILDTVAETSGVSLAEKRSAVAFEQVG